MLLALLVLPGCLFGGGCADVYGPQGVMVTFLVPDEGDYRYTVTGEAASMDCAATVPSQDVACEGDEYGFNPPAEADGGGWTFGSLLSTTDEGTVHVSLTLDGDTLLDTDTVPDWEPAADEGNCADYERGSASFDLRGDTGS
jgi:hypothetical protein